MRAKKDPNDCYSKEFVESNERRQAELKAGQDASRKVAMPVGTILAAIKLKASPEAKQWLDTIQPDEVAMTEHQIQIIGEDSFLATWEHHRNDLEYYRNF